MDFSAFPLSSNVIDDRPATEHGRALKRLMVALQPGTRQPIGESNYNTAPTLPPFSWTPGPFDADIDASAERTKNAEAVRLLGHYNDIISRGGWVRGMDPSGPFVPFNERGQVPMTAPSPSDKMPWGEEDRTSAIARLLSGWTGR